MASHLAGTLDPGPSAAAAAPSPKAPTSKPKPPRKVVLPFMATPSAMFKHKGNLQAQAGALHNTLQYAGGAPGAVAHAITCEGRTWLAIWQDMVGHGSFWQGWC